MTNCRFRSIKGASFCCGYWEYLTDRLLDFAYRLGVEGVGREELLEMSPGCAIEGVAHRRIGENLRVGAVGQPVLKIGSNLPLLQWATHPIRA